MQSYGAGHLVSGLTSVLVWPLLGVLGRCNDEADLILHKAGQRGVFSGQGLPCVSRSGFLLPYGYLCAGELKHCLWVRRSTFSGLGWATSQAGGVRSLCLVAVVGSVGLSERGFLCSR
jgi:hypothetical protein